MFSLRRYERYTNREYYGTTSTDTNNAIRVAIVIPTTLILKGTKMSKELGYILIVLLVVIVLEDNHNRIKALTLQYEQAKNAHLEASRVWNTERYQKHLENATYVRRAE